MKKILFYITKNNIFVIRDGFNLKALFLINFSFKQLPNLFPSEFTWDFHKMKISNIPFDSKKRNSIKYTSSFKGEFNKYINSFIVNDIPTCYLEGFKNLTKIANKININTNLILSSAKHFHDELFKLWICQKQIFKKIKFIVFEHGGWHQKNNSTYNYAEFISDKTIEWRKNKNYNFLPIPHFIFKDSKRKKSELLLYVDRVFTPYPVRNVPGPMSFSSNRTIKNLNILFKRLNHLPKSSFYYAGKNNIEKLQYLEMKKIIGTERILEKNSLSKYLYRSKLVICSYPQTAFIESMVTGPTILIYDPKQLGLSSEFKKSYRMLKKAKIIFNDTSAASNHINKNWNKIDQWWNQKDVVKSRNYFLNKFDMPKSNSLKRWYYFINRNISN